MILSILAGFLIGIGALIYLLDGTFLGMCMFSLGLLSILNLRLELFTGKAGLLATHDISGHKLFQIYCGNLIGTFIIASLASVAGLADKVAEPAAAIIQKRIITPPITSIALGILCGILMYVAVTSLSQILTIMCVSAFIFLGAHHCVADMFYMWIGADAVTLTPALGTLCYTTIGNLIGCNAIPWTKTNIK